MTRPHTSLRFVRHGATAANLLGLRCGGDLDLSLSELGRKQAVEAALRVATLETPVRLIVTSALKRTRETAEIIARMIGGAEILIEPEFSERRLGEWNLLAIDETRPWLDRGLTPPGGEGKEAFATRIARATRRLIRSGLQDVLLVGSKGVARVLGEMCGMESAAEIANGDLAEFELADGERFAVAVEAL